MNRSIWLDMARGGMALVLLVQLGTGCGDSEGECGPGDAPAAGVSTTVDGVTILYGGFDSSPNNDCTAPGGPTSLSIHGFQSEPAPSVPFSITFCLPRPDQVGSEPVSLANAELVEVVDVSAELEGGCILVLDRSTPPSGTIRFAGYCGSGLSESGYAIELDGAVAGLRICAGMADEPVTMTLGGAAAVTAAAL